jgi:hypothetical protein
MGAIEGRFVDPEDGSTPTVVAQFRFDAGYFDSFGSTRLVWFDPDGRRLGQRTNSRFGIERLSIKGGDIASWRIEIVANEPAGFAIDNVSYEPLGPSVLFRERGDDFKDGSWGLQKDEIPGWDHSAFQIDGIVFESHPGYPSGTYVTADSEESVTVTEINGVQSQFSRSTFAHDSTSQNSTPVVDFEEIPVDRSLAEGMREFARAQIAAGATFGFINFEFPDGVQATLSPEVQKGSRGTFTCVGLVEAAAETAGRNSGQGFVPNAFEEVVVPAPGLPPSLIRIPTLSPMLLNFAMKTELTLDTIVRFFQGAFDPVELEIIDPLGRRLGHTSADGEWREVPRAFYSGAGKYQQFLIPTPVPGNYTVRVIGLGEAANGAVQTHEGGQALLGKLEPGEERRLTQVVAVYAGAPGDVTNDGTIDERDREALLRGMNRYVDRPDDPADLNADGEISVADLHLIERLIQTQEAPTITCRNPAVGTAADACAATLSCDEIARCTDPVLGVVSPTCAPGDSFGPGETLVEVRCQGASTESTAACAVVVGDDDPPVGQIVVARECSSIALELVDDFVDNCPGALTRQWDPGPDPLNEHGDVHIVLTVHDGAGNAAIDAVDVTIDRIPPAVHFAIPRDNTLSVPSAIPLNVVFSATDDDGARGSIVHEAMMLGTCTVFDGATYGDKDGLLADETVAITRGVLCDMVPKCGVTRLTRPVLRVEASDCAGNVGWSEVQLSGSIALLPGMCTQ